MRRLVVRQQAEREIREILGWYEEQRPGLGMEFKAAVDAVFRQLREYPEAYPLVFSSARRVVMRRFPYLIFYRIRRDGTVSVTGCVHARRDPDFWQSRV